MTHSVGQLMEWLGWLGAMLAFIFAFSVAGHGIGLVLERWMDRRNTEAARWVRRGRP